MRIFGVRNRNQVSLWGPGIGGSKVLCFLLMRRWRFSDFISFTDDAICPVESDEKDRIRID